MWQEYTHSYHGPFESILFGTVAADRFDRAPLQRFVSQCDFIPGLRLTVHDGQPEFFVASEEIGRGGVAEMAVDAVRIDVVSASGVLSEAFGYLGHTVILLGIGLYAKFIDRID